MRLQNQLLKLMKKRDYRPLTFKQLAEVLDQPKSNKGGLERAIKILEQEGQIVAIRKNRYALAGQLNTFVGHLELNRKGFGFVVTEDADIYVRMINLNGAMNGDKVLAEVIQRGRRKKEEGHIIKVLDRASRTVVGEFERRGARNFILPADKRMPYEVIVPAGQVLDAGPGQIVVAEIVEYPEKHNLKVVAKVVEVLGEETEPGVDIEMIIREHGLVSEFPPVVLAEIEEIPDEVEASELIAVDRKDYRQEFTVTIDGLDAKDFDDAVSIGRTKEGGFHLKVHIADVSHYVRPRTALDEETAKRSFSVYLVDRVLPMLPPKLSNGICSLNPGVDRLSLSVEIVIDRQGEVVRFEIHEGIIRSDYRLTYEEADEAFASGKFSQPKVEELLLLMRDLSDVLEAKRVLKGSINFETVESKVILDELGSPVEIKLREKTAATKLIEEAMIVTNETVAGFLRQKDFPAVYRVHERPDLNEIEPVVRLLVELGYPVQGLREGRPKAFQKVVELAHPRQDRWLVNSVLLRSMKQARYATHLKPHFGLASECYTHFTSPIRRYPDLLVHRLTKAALGLEKLGFEPENLPRMAEHASVQEREADEAERESDEVKICELMKRDHLGDVFDGLISGVVGFGFFVQLPNSAEGLVHIRDLSDDYYYFEPERFRLQGSRTGRIYQLGQPVTVQVARVNVPERRIDLALAP